MSYVQFNGSATGIGGGSGGTLADLGDGGFYAGKNHLFTAPPTVTQMTSDYGVTDSIKLIGQGVWNGGDVWMLRNSDLSEVHFWFGSPETGTQVVHDYAVSAAIDLMIDNQVIEGGKTYRFLPQKLMILGDTMIAFCSVTNVTDDTSQQVGFLTAPMSAIQAGDTDQWTVHAVSPIATGDGTDDVGQVWSCQQEYTADGIVMFGWSDYADGGSKEGGVSGMTGFTPEGVYDDSLVTDDYAYSGSHAHPPCFCETATGHAYTDSRNDGKGLMTRYTISDLSTYADGATTEVGGIGSSFKMKGDISETGWSSGTVIAGTDLTDDALYNNSAWPNNFMLGAMPADPTKIMLGADISYGIVNALTLDSTHGMAYLENLYGPTARHISADEDESAQPFNLFYLARNGNHLAGIVFNEMARTDGERVLDLSSVVYSSDGGLTWRVVWRGSSVDGPAGTVGVTANAGIIVLQDGTILLGTQDDESSIRVIRPGATVTAEPLRVGSRGVNILGDDSDQQSNPPSSGWLTSVGTTPELALPSFLHNTKTWKVTRVEANGNTWIKPVIDSLDESDAKSYGIEIAYWVRKLDPAGTAPEHRMGISLLLGLEISGLSFAEAKYRNAPFLGGFALNEWVRHTTTIKGSNFPATAFNEDPSDILMYIRGNGQQNSINYSELFYESFVADGRQRPSLPGGAIDDSGIASHKFTGIGGSSDEWTILLRMRIPEDCWDQAAGGYDDGWDDPVPIFTVCDSTETDAITFDAHLSTSATGGVGNTYDEGELSLGFFDSGNATRTTETGYVAVRGDSMIVAISSSGAYAIGMPRGMVSGTRAGVPSITLDRLLLSGLDGAEVLEMDHAGFDVDLTERTASELETLVQAGRIPLLAPRGGRSRHLLLLLGGGNR